MFDGVIIKAAGNGSRLKPLTDYVPKPFVLYKEKQLIEYQFDLCNKNNLRNICISVQSSFLSNLKNIPDKSIIFINDSNINGQFIDMFITNDIKGIWLVLCADIITDFDFKELYQKSIDLNTTFVVTPILATKKATHTVDFDSQNNKWFFCENGKYILSGVSVINFNKFAPDQFDDYDIASMWNKCKLNQDLGFAKIQFNEWKSIDFIADLDD